MATLAGVFSGQASVYSGMLEGFGSKETRIIKETFEEASSVVGFDLWSATRKEGGRDTGSPLLSQVSVTTAGVALYRLWKNSVGKTLSVGIGHSVGNFPLLVSAGQISFSDAIKTVVERAHFMDEAVPADKGASVAIVGEGFLEIAQSLCSQDIGADVAVVNDPKQFVISGIRHRVEEIVAILKKRGLKKSIKLGIGPVHCREMEPARRKFRIFLESVRFQASKGMRVIHSSKAAHLAEVLADQLTHREDWLKKMHLLSKESPEIIIEVGAKRVLLSFIEKFFFGKGVHYFCINDQQSLEMALAADAVIS